MLEVLPSDDGIDSDEIVAAVRVSSTGVDLGLVCVQDTSRSVINISFQLSLVVVCRDILSDNLSEGKESLEI